MEGSQRQISSSSSRASAVDRVPLLARPYTRPQPAAKRDLQCPREPDHRGQARIAQPTLQPTDLTRMRPRCPREVAHRLALTLALAGERQAERRRWRAMRPSGWRGVHTGYPSKIAAACFAVLLAKTNPSIRWTSPAPASRARVS